LSNGVAKAGLRGWELEFILPLNCHVVLHKTLGIAALIFPLETALRILR